MENLTSASSDDFSSVENPINSAGSTSAVCDDDLGDACSICLEPFSDQDPASVTSCKHEYHLQCILEWSQRSKECPICWQMFVLKDPVSQELLAAAESERSSRSRNISLGLPRVVSHFRDDYVNEEDHWDASDIDEVITGYLPIPGRSQFDRRREMQRSYGLSHSRDHATSLERNQYTNSNQTEGDSPTSIIQGTANIQPPSAVSSYRARNRDDYTKTRRYPLPHSAERTNPPELLSIPESIKSKWSAASTRYKESFSKRARDLKEKLLSRNNSVKELSKGVQREMNAGIAGVTRMIERLELATKRPTTSVRESRTTSGPSFKGKGVEDNAMSQTRVKINGEVEHGFSAGGPSLSRTIPRRLGISKAESRR